jgi:hypothetical protein
MTRQGYVLPLMFPFDSDQIRSGRVGHDAGAPEATEDVMKKVTARAIARPAPPVREVEIWTMALWLVALAFLLTAVRFY